MPYKDPEMHRANSRKAYKRNYATWYAERGGKEIRREHQMAQLHGPDWRKILERDGYRCGVCGLRGNIRDNVHEHEGTLEIDHILPPKLGGDNSMENQQTLCVSCHRRKDALLRYELGRNIGRRWKPGEGIPYPV